jgi:DNA-binding HxlR family transcriptional regulator
MAEAARSGCPINAAVEAFGDSWSLLVLRDVMFGNRRYFRELLAGSEEGIASNILASRLKRLVSAGLLTREDAGPGRRAAYSLTEASIQLVPVFAELGEWGLRHRPATERLAVRAELLSAGGPELWAEFMAELRAVHLGAPPPDRDGPGVMQRLADARARAAAP